LRKGFIVGSYAKFTGRTTGLNGVNRKRRSNGRTFPCKKGALREVSQGRREIRKLRFPLWEKKIPFREGEFVKEDQFGERRLLIHAELEGFSKISL